MSDETIFLSADKSLPSRCDAVQNRAEILAAARRLFAEHNIRDISMAEIAREAAVGKGTLYRHFRNKADLCYALLDKDQQDFQDETFLHLRTATDEPATLLFWFLHRLCDFTEAHSELLVETTYDHTAFDQLRLEHHAHHWQWLTITGLLRRTPLQGDLEYVGDVLYTLLDPRVYYFQRHVRGYTPERIKAGVLAVAEQLLSMIS